MKEFFLERVKEKRNLFKNKRGKILRHLLQHDDLMKVIIEGKIARKGINVDPEIAIVNKSKRQ